MKTRQQEAAGKIIEAALKAGMLYVQPCVYRIPEGWACTKCGNVIQEHKLGCEPPFGLKALSTVK
jgi:hypothetical protein